MRARARMPATTFKKRVYAEQAHNNELNNEIEHKEDENEEEEWIPL